jgi:hypothetical protein
MGEFAFCFVIRRLVFDKQTASSWLEHNYHCAIIHFIGNNAVIASNLGGISGGILKLGLGNRKVVC